MNFSSFLGFLLILKHSIKLIYRNWKPMSLLTTLSLVSSSIFYLIYNFSSFSLMRDMLAKESLIPISSPLSSEFNNQYLSHIKGNFPRLLATEITFILSYFLISFLPTIGTVIVSSYSNNSKNLSIKEFSFRIVKCWMRPLKTGFYTSTLVIGYIFLVLYMASPLLASARSLSDLGSAVLFGIVAYVFYLYIRSVWILGLVVSVIDEKSCGMVALGKSAEIMKGQRMNAFGLNIVLSLLSLGVYFGSSMIKGEKYWMSDEKLSGLFRVNGSCLVTILTFVAYTVLYSKGKGSGQEIELNWSNAEYGKLSTGPLADFVP